MKPSLDLSALDLRDALDLAILIEEEAAARYRELSRQVGGRYPGDAADVFLQMVQAEGKHAEQLEARRRELFGDAPRRLDASQIWQVEAPTLGDVRVFMSPRQALAVAADAEARAYEFYDSALRQVTDPATQALFTELRDEEAQHIEAVRALMEALPPGPDVDDDDADEPPGL